MVSAPKMQPAASQEKLALLGQVGMLVLGSTIYEMTVC